MGGIRLETAGRNRGELSFLTNKESGTSGLVTRSGHTAEDMAAMLRDEGYPASRNPDEFLQELADELRTGRAVYTAQREYDPAEGRPRASPGREGQRPTADAPKAQALASARKLPSVDSFMHSRKGEAGFINIGEVLTTTKRNAIDILNAPRSLMSSFDLSAPLRQGAILTLTEPKATVAAMKGMLQALVSTGKYNAIGTAIATDVDFSLAQDAGLYLSMIEQAKAKAAQAKYKSQVAAARAQQALTPGVPVNLPKRPLSVREESFMSELAEKVPHVKYSEQAYVAYLDLQRFQAFKKYAAELRRAGLNPNTNAQEFKDIAKFINSATGRGDLGKTLNSAAPVLNAIFFSPRYLASRVNLINPATYVKMSPMARRIALRKMIEFGALVGLTLLLAMLGGAEVEWDDPDSPDWLKIKVGNTRYDFLAGFQQPMRFIYRMSKAMKNNLTGKGNDRNKNATDIGTNFLRSKLSPVASYVYDWMSGSTFDRQPFKLGQGIIDRVVPMVGRDFYEAYQDQGVKGIAKASPSILGVGVQTYKPYERKSGRSLSPRPGLPSRPRLPSIP
jgi:hypothetical protein